MDFVVDITKEGGALPPRVKALDTDTALTVTYTAAMTYRKIRTSDPLGKRWIIHHGHHCAWAGDAEFLRSEIRPAILRGLKLQR